MEEKRTLITREGLRDLEEELNDLRVRRRAEVAQKIKEAREQGDLSENAEYDAARDEQRDIEARIAEIEGILKTVEVADDDADDTKANVGRRIVIINMETSEEMTVDLVGTNEANILENRISNESPVGREILGRSVGDIITVEAPAGIYKYRILAIDKTPKAEKTA